MKASVVAAQYIAHKRSLGMRFNSEERALKSFCCYVRDVPLSQIKPVQIRAFLDGRGPVTQFWHHKYSVLRGFYRYAIAHGHLSTSPLPNFLPKAPPPFVPYIFTHDELWRLVQATATCQSPRCLLQAERLRALLLLLYGAALRISEALSLTLGDVDLENAVLLIHESKFYKSRWVPISSDLCGVLERYIRPRGTRHRNNPNAPLFAG